MSQFIKIQWNASPSPISGYNVYRGNSFGNESLSPLNTYPITDTFYEDMTVFPGQQYNYVVTAVLNGVESLDSLRIFTEPIAFLNSPSPLELNAFSGFGLLAASTITNVPETNSQVTGNVGVYPGSSVTGFEDVRISGAYHLADYVAGYAQNSITNAFNVGMALSGTTVPAELGGLKLAPGIYKNTSSCQITGVLVLDGQGNPNASWVFQIGSTLSTADGNSHVVLVGGAQATNVNWLVGSSATLGVDTFFAGNIIAYASITVNTDACVDGRLGARTGAITLEGNSVVIYSSCNEPLPSSPPNTPPSPPSSPTGVIIEDLNADTVENNVVILANVVTSAVTLIDTNSAVGGGNIQTDGYDETVVRGICWSRNINPTILSNKTINGSGVGTFESNITGLIPITSYYVRAYATNSFGTAYGENVTFTTIN